MKKAGWLIALLGICLVMTVMLLMFLPVFNITQIIVTGNDQVSAETIKSIAADNSKNIFAYSSKKTKKALAKNYYIQSSKIKKVLPNTIIVEVTENKIRGYVEYTGSYLCLSDDGLVIDVKSEITYPAPIITGLKFDTFTLGEKLETDDPAVFDVMIEMAMLFNRYELTDSIIKVDISDPEDIRFYCGSVQVIYGKSDGTTERMSTLIEILKKLDTTIPGTLDLTLDNPTFVYTN